MLLPTRFAFRTLLPALAIPLSSISFGQTAHPPVAVTNPPVESVSPVRNVEARTYDLSEAIAAYVHDSKLPANEARAEAVLQLFAPVGENEFPIRREEISPGRFKVWATQSFHAFLPVMVQWMKNDKKQICIEARIVTVTEEALKNLHATFYKQWEMSTISEVGANTTPDAILMSVQSTPPITFATFKKQPNRSTDFISATTSTVQSLPGRVARLTGDQAKKLIAAQQADASSNTLQAPKITIFPGQEATIKDTVQRPFVVSVKPVKGDKGTAMQPIIRVLEDGLTIQLRASLHGDDQLDIDSEITFNRIGNVDEFTFQSHYSGEETTVQIPEQHMRQVRLSKTIDDGATLLIDPHFFKEKTINKRFRSPVTTRQYTIVLLTPSIIHATPNLIK